MFIESNDYNVGATDAYVITGAQILGSTEGITGDGISLEGSTGLDGGSSATLRDFGADTSESTSEPIKISDIGFVIANSANLDADLYFDVAVIDYDGDVTTTQRLNVTIDSSPLASAPVELMTQEPELLV